MLTINMSCILAFVLSFGLIISGTTNAASVELIVDNATGTPELQGAKNVLVDGTLYDVVFLDGTCADVFMPCAQASFTFSSVIQADLAAHALLEQVFLDVAQGDFDSVPTLTRGCSRDVFCEAATVWNDVGSELQVVTAVNFPASGGADIIGSASPLKTHNFSDDTALFWARWTPATTVVPIPAAVWLFGSGLIGLIGLARRKA